MISIIVILVLILCGLLWFYVVKESFVSNDADGCRVVNIDDTQDLSCETGEFLSKIKYASGKAKITCCKPPKSSTS